MLHCLLCGQISSEQNKETIALEKDAEILTSKPRHEDYLRVSEVHELYYALYGNPEGIPVVVLHGGPGLGTNDGFCNSFDLKKYNVVMFDQRGAMRSKPFACMDDNTTQDCIGDIDKLRKHLGIDSWVVFGGSWGSFLGVLYGQEHPKRCLGFVLRGIFLGRPQDNNFFIKEKGFEDLYEEFTLNFPEEERHDLLAASYKRVMDPDPKVHMHIARAFTRFRLISANCIPYPTYLDKLLQNDQQVLSLSRAALYYSFHNMFIESDQVLSHMDPISHLPAIIIQGNADRATHPEQALLLNQNWGNSRLWMIDAGHSAEDPTIAEALFKATETMAQELLDNNQF